VQVAVLKEATEIVMLANRIARQLTGEGHATGLLRGELLCLVEVSHPEEGLRYLLRGLDLLTALRLCVTDADHQAHLLAVVSLRQLEGQWRVADVRLGRLLLGIGQLHLVLAGPHPLRLAGGERLLHHLLSRDGFHLRLRGGHPHLQEGGHLL
jgi:hypothetical protein